MLELLHCAGDPRAERVFLARTKDGHLIEWAQAGPRMISVSPSLGCPVGCLFCDAGKFYKGKLDAAEIFAQIDHVVGQAGAASELEQPLGIEFSKVGEPSFNGAVLEVLAALPQRFGPLKVVPIVSTVAPDRTEAFFEELISVRRSYGPDAFGLRISLHSSDEAARRALIPIKSWSFDRIARYGQRFCRPYDRKVALRFALSPSLPLDVGRLAPIFSPEFFSIELTALNANDTTRAQGLRSEELPGSLAVAHAFRAAGFEVAVFSPNPVADALRASCGMSLAAKLDSPLPPRRRRTNEQHG